MNKAIHTISRFKILLPVATLSLLTILSAFALSSPRSSAETRKLNAAVHVPDTCSTNAVDSGTATVDNPYEMIGGMYVDNISSTTINITCNDRNGYSLYAVGYGNGDVGNTNMIGHESGNVIPTGTVSDGSVSNWSFRLTPISGVYTPSILSDTNGSFASNHVIPPSYTKVATFTGGIDVTAESSLTATYAVGVEHYQTPDIYTGQVRYTLVHPNFASSEEMVYMQDLTPSMIADLLPNVGNTFVAYDKRDNQSYKIAKLADGKYWMVENLNLAGGTTITPADSNVTESYTLPASAIKNTDNNNLTDATQFSDDNTAYVFNSGNKTNCGASGQNVPCGSYYSYLAATADTGANTIADGYNASDSICPKGWRLPTATTEGVGRDSGGYTGGDFYQMILAETGQSSLANGFYESTANFYNNAGPGTTLGFLLAGGYDGSTLYGGGSIGYYWSSTSRSGTNAYGLHLNSSYVNSANNNSRRYGFSVRCVFEDRDITDISTMQEISPAIAANTAVGTMATLTDSRDNEQYLVSKLADNNIWMLDNLRLGATTLTTDLTSNNTNLSTTISAADWNSYSATEGFVSYISPMFNNESANTTVTSYGAGSGKVGVYYNYCAASAGTYCMPEGSGTSNTSYDICPKGWRMPTGGLSGEYQALYAAYSSNATNFRAALSTPLSGYFYGSSAYSQGSYGYFRSSTYYDGYDMYSLRVDSSNVNPTNDGNRGSGFSVRCILK